MAAHLDYMRLLHEQEHTATDPAFAGFSLDIVADVRPDPDGANYEVTGLNMSVVREDAVPQSEEAGGRWADITMQRATVVKTTPTTLARLFYESHARLFPDSAEAMDAWERVDSQTRARLVATASAVLSRLPMGVNVSGVVGATFVSETPPAAGDAPIGGRGVLPESPALTHLAVTKKEPDISHGVEVLRLSLGSSVDQPEAAYLVYRGDLDACQHLLAGAAHLFSRLTREPAITADDDHRFA